MFYCVLVMFYKTVSIIEQNVWFSGTDYWCKGGRGVAVYLYKKQYSFLHLLHIFDPVIQNSSTENARACNKTLQL